MTRRHLAALSTEAAYRVPWSLERDAIDGQFSLRNLGLESLSGVTVSLYGSGELPTTAPRTLHSGDILEVEISGYDLARNSIAIVRWFRPDGSDYLWRISF